MHRLIGPFCRRQGLFLVIAVIRAIVENHFNFVICNTIIISMQICTDTDRVWIDFNCF